MSEMEWNSADKQADESSAELEPKTKVKKVMLERTALESLMNTED